MTQYMCVCIYIMYVYIYKLDIMPNNTNSKSALEDKVTVLARIITLNFLNWLQLDT